MLRSVCLYVLALVLPCWAYPFVYKTSCEEFGRGISFDPVKAVGDWFNLYSFESRKNNFTERFTIRELTSSQLQQYQMLKHYSKDKLKLVMKTHVSHPFVADMESVLVPLDYAGNVDAWTTYNRINGIDSTMNNEGPDWLKWKTVDGFLVLMRCYDHKVYVLSNSATPDEDKLRHVVKNLHIEGITGKRVYPSLI